MVRLFYWREGRGGREGQVTGVTDGRDVAGAAVIAARELLGAGFFF